MPDWVDPQQFRAYCTGGILSTSCEQKAWERRSVNIDSNPPLELPYVICKGRDSNALVTYTQSNLESAYGLLEHLQQATKLSCLQKATITIHQATIPCDTPCIHSNKHDHPLRYSLKALLAWHYPPQSLHFHKTKLTLPPPPFSDPLIHLGRILLCFISLLNNKLERKPQNILQG